MAEYDEPATIEDAEDALEQALTSGADLDKIAAMGAAYAAEGVEPEDAIVAAADWHDMTGLDEMQAAQKIGERESWE
jgi:hypothetical protein